LLKKIHKELGIPNDYGSSPAIPSFSEPSVLEPVGPNIVGRPQQLTPSAARGWRAMASAAASDGVTLLIVSGYRSITYQKDLIAKKLAKGQMITDILRVNAAPGFSQHHTGRAIDIATPESRPLTTEFESTPAFAWLNTNAAAHGFSMPYERDNPWDIDYEPWHWFYDEASQT
jgi:D-alanyl-D-alanine carboxypeptidase